MMMESNRANIEGEEQFTVNDSYIKENRQMSYVD